MFDHRGIDQRTKTCLITGFDQVMFSPTYQPQLGRSRSAYSNEYPLVYLKQSHKSSTPTSVWQNGMVGRDSKQVKALSLLHTFAVEVQQSLKCKSCACPIGNREAAAKDN